MIRPGELVIEDFKPEGLSTGLIPRDYQSFPRGAHPSCKAIDFPLLDMSQWPDIIRQKEADKSRLSDVRLAGNNGNPIPSLDQNGDPYCWAHSSTSANTILRALAGLPYIPLSAYAVAATIKKGRKEGGWGAQSCDFIMEKGQPSQALWPQGDRNYAKYQSLQAVWENALQHKILEGFIDLAVPEYDRELSKQQVGTLLLSDVPVIVDYNWWSHSVLALDLLDLEPSRSPNDFLRYGTRIWNSWNDSWSDRGMGVLKGKQAWPDGAVAPRATGLSF
jgi:hypothetical protein